MLILAALALLANAVFNVLTWPRFYRRVVADPRAHDAEGRPTRFRTVHLVLLVIALTLAAVSAAVGVVLIVVAAVA